MHDTGVAAEQEAAIEARGVADLEAFGRRQTTGRFTVHKPVYCKLNLARRGRNHRDLIYGPRKGDQEAGALDARHGSQAQNDGLAVGRYFPDIRDHPADRYHDCPEQEEAEGKRDRLPPRANISHIFGQRAHLPLRPGAAPAVAAPGPSTRARKGAASLRMTRDVPVPTTVLSVSSDRSIV